MSGKDGDTMPQGHLRKGRGFKSGRTKNLTGLQQPPS